MSDYALIQTLRNAVIAARENIIRRAEGDPYEDDAALDFDDAETLDALDKALAVVPA